MLDLSFLATIPLPLVLLDEYHQDSVALTPGQGVNTSDVLRQSLAVLSGLAADEIKLARTQAGKPVVTNLDLHFSISHTDQWLAFAFSQAPIGVDVESLRGQPSMKLARRFFTSEEVTWLESLALDAQDEAFIRLWVLKESYVKQYGSTLARTLGTVGFVRDVPSATGSGQPIDATLQCGVWSLNATTRLGVTWQHSRAPVFCDLQGQVNTLPRTPPPC